MTVVLAPNKQTMKIKTTEEEYNTKLIRFLLLTITIMFMLLSFGLQVMGVSVYAHYHSLSFFFSGANSGYLVTPSVLCILLGIALMFVAIIGFAGSVKKSTCMVNFYALMLILIFIVKLVVVILAFTMDVNTMMDYIYFPISQYTTDPEVQAEIDMVQEQGGCCGAYSYTDYADVKFTSNHSTLLASRIVNGDKVTFEIPSSCCSKEYMNYCDGLMTIGCKAAIVDSLSHNATVLGVLGVSFLIINLLGIIFALLLARCIRKMKSQRALQLWKIKEQIIMAREVEEQAKAEQNRVYIEQQATSIA